ncbi:DUF3679 domain-containing protein [Bacillus spongiae]|uniref:DUF3679 domain-containing protein n=1 Tax=Bacillus spongiae TaxID=2683610 RepID=A0ABU8H9G3_9BACI
MNGGCKRMTTFLTKCIVLMTTLFIGVLIGMQVASSGMSNDDGYLLADPSIHYSIGEEEGYPNETIFEKQEKLEEMKSFNFFSSIGKGLAEAVSTVINVIIETVSSFL